MPLFEVTRGAHRYSVESGDSSTNEFVQRKIAWIRSNRSTRRSGSGVTRSPTWGLAVRVPRAAARSGGACGRGFRISWPRVRRRRCGARPAGRGRRLSGSACPASAPSGFEREARKRRSRSSPASMSMSRSGRRASRSTGRASLPLQVSDVSLKTTDGKPMADAGRVRFGVRLMPLLSGEVRLTSARISDAHIVVAALPSRAATGPRSCATRTASSIRRRSVRGGVRQRATRRSTRCGEDSMRRDRSHQCRVRAAATTGRSSWSGSPTPGSGRAGPAGMEFSSEADVDGRPLTIAASATRDRRRAAGDSACSASVEAVEAAAGNQARPRPPSATWARSR